MQRLNYRCANQQAGENGMYLFVRDKLLTITIIASNLNNLYMFCVLAMEIVVISLHFYIGSLFFIL